MMDQLKSNTIRNNVRNRYKGIVSSSGCCGPANYSEVSAQMGYSDDELKAVPEGANLGLSCGNPQAIAELKRGETVLDLGSGGGFDCFLASRKVGESGQVIGVDMTAEMISRARENAVKGEFTNTSFRLGEIEHLPVPDQHADVIISNCVINLSPMKEQVFKEAYRVLRPNGRLAISDIVITTELPAEIKHDIDEIYSGCISGASSINELEKMLTDSGFTDVVIQPKDESKEFIKDWLPGANAENYIVSALITGVKRE